VGAGESAGADMIDWYVEPDHSRAEPHMRASSRFRREQERANSLALIVTISLLFVLFASALMVGGRSAIGPLLSRGTTAHDANSKGDIVYAMPDGVYCRHLSFDNTTGAISVGTVEPCTERSRSAGPEISTTFKWNTR
jgi:hypothetical protein